jgi:hypothetical protein
MLLAAAVTAPGEAVATQPQAGGVHYAKVKRVCPLPRRGRATCLSLRLEPAASGAANAAPYAAGAGAASTGPAGGLTPADLASAYRYSPSGGSGQTVGIVDAFDDPNLESDLATFDAQYGLVACTAANGCLRKVGETGSSTSLPAADKVGWSVEITLDVETVHSVCPACSIVLVEASSERLSDLAASEETVVGLGAAEVSNSYGALEPEMGAIEHAAYEHPGIVILAAAGDSGYLSWDRVFEGGEAPGVPDEPASFPSVVAVGGTSLKLTATGARKSETTWNDSGRPSHEELKQFAATGSGCSTVYTAPTWQQEVPGWAAAGCASKRLDNDVSAVADPYTGFDIYDSFVYEKAFKPGWLTIGGTSLSSPLVAGLYALSGGAHGASEPASLLYGHLGQSSALYDVTKGGSGFCDGEEAAACGEPTANELFGPVDCEGTIACDAAVGYDGPTGVGAPRGLSAFTPATPVVVTKAANSITASSAVLNATVNPEGHTLSGCTFEYGPTAGYGHTAPCSSTPPPGTVAVAVSAPVSGLAEKATYHFRITASNGFGTALGKDHTLKTL